MKILLLNLFMQVNILLVVLVKLTDVDSLAFHFRLFIENAALRSKVLHKIASQVSSLAVERHFALLR
jgi:hypothetical protein